MLKKRTGGFDGNCDFCNRWFAADSTRYIGRGKPLCLFCGDAYNSGFQAREQAPKPNDGGPAYPGRSIVNRNHQTGEPNYEDVPGMPLRDRFAGALVLRDSDFIFKDKAWPDVRLEACKAAGVAPAELELDHWACVRLQAAVEARIRYIKADAMLAERDKGGDDGKG